MRVGGLATGMDIEQMVNRLMDAERIPYTRLMQDRTKLTWKQDAFRELNKSLLELDQLSLDMKLSHTYNAKKATSTDEGAITGVPASNAGNGIYQLEVTELATSAMVMSTDRIEQTIPADYVGEHAFTTFDSNGEEQVHTFTVNKDDTVTAVLKRISEADNSVRAFYDQTSGKVIVEMTRTGVYNPDGGPEIIFQNVHPESGTEHFFNHLNLGEEKAASDATFIYNNGAKLTSKNNEYELDGTVFQFHNVTKDPVRITVQTDEDAVFDSIVAYVDAYNDVVEKFTSSQQEERFRDFHPLSDDQKKEMSDDEVKKWEEKAQSGMLRGESIITSGLFNMRSSWYGKVSNDSAHSSITEIGITTTERYLDGGKLEIDEDILRKAIRDDSASVQALFSNSAEGSARGIVHRLDDEVNHISRSINERAGRGTDTFDNYTLGKRMNAINDRITDFEARLTRIETRYWNQFTQMEKAIQRMNDQSSQLFSQFGGM